MQTFSEKIKAVSEAAHATWWELDGKAAHSRSIWLHLKELTLAAEADPEKSGQDIWVARYYSNRCALVRLLPLLADSWAAFCAQSDTIVPKFMQRRKAVESAYHEENERLRGLQRAVEMKADTEVGVPPRLVQQWLQEAAQAYIRAHSALDLETESQLKVLDEEIKGVQTTLFNEMFPWDKVEEALNSVSF